MSSDRQVVKRCFALLKGKWRRLKGIDISNLNYLKDIIIASCCLHNFTLDLPFFTRHEDDNHEDDNDEGSGNKSDEDDDYDGIRKRDEIAAFFSPQDDD